MAKYLSPCKYTFSLNDNVNRKNVRYWNDINPRLRNVYTQYSQKVIVCADILENRIICLFRNQIRVGRSGTSECPFLLIKLIYIEGILNFSWVNQ